MAPATLLRLERSSPSRGVFGLGADGLDHPHPVALSGSSQCFVVYAFNNRAIQSAFLKGRYLNQELIDKGHAKPV